MPTEIPHFKYRFVNTSQKRVPCIETGGKVIHEIKHLDEFYKMFGYTQEMSKSGVLPDEFIWAEYIKDSTVDYSPCLQMHIIEYLRTHSDIFQKEYGDQCESWITAHAAVRAKRGAACAACRIKPLCDK